MPKPQLSVEEIKFAKRLEKDAIEHYEEDKREIGFSLVDYAKQENIKLWRLIGAMTELHKRFNLEKDIPLTEADKTFLKWGLYHITDIELGKLKREKLLKRLREVVE